MNLRYLGEQIDIHGGGKDLLFPHHENEIAQTEALTGKRFAKYWIHNGLITINGQKMSKSLHNSLTVKDALAKYNKEVIKYMLMQKHYASTVDINDAEFLLAEKHMYYFYNTINEIDKILSLTPANEDIVNNDVLAKIEPDFVEAMDDDFNTAEAYANLFAIMKYLNTIIQDKKMEIQTKSNILKAIKDKIIMLYNILSIFEEKPNEFINDLKNKYLNKLNISSEEIENQIQERVAAKQNKDYALADSIRNELDAKGIVLLDSKEGTTWSIKELQ
jgi:cysteinyl-tRNA synthetase